MPFMNDGKLIRNINLEKEEKEILRPLALLTSKPVLYVTNVDEAEIASNLRGRFSPKCI